MLPVFPACPFSFLCASSQKIGRELGTHKKIVPGLGAHKRSHPDLKLLTKLEMSSPDLSEVRVQRLTMLETSSPDQSTVRAQHVTWAEMFNANPKVARVPL